MSVIRDIKKEWDSKVPLMQNKVSKMYGAEQPYNPFLDKDGNVFNKYIDHQGILDNPNVATKAKQFISDATGLAPNVVQGYSTIKNPVAQPSVAVSATGNAIADSAQKFIGTPYVWGGESMEEGGMDCSGFVYNALKDAGYKIGRTTAQGYRGYGTSVGKAEMQPGDLIFYGKDGNASHVGIYIGDGKMVHSAGGSKNTASNPGKGVSVASVNHRSDFLEARRY
jgi:cell wall-associated NlpC family hydrolase